MVYHQNSLLTIWYKLKQINIAYLRNIPEKLSQLKKALEQTQHLLIQDPPNRNLILAERKGLEEIERWSNIEEGIWKQKSRVVWLKLGDSNTKFFHSYAKARQSHKAINLLISANGDRCVTQRQIMDEVRGFYVNLMGSAAETLPMVDKSIIAQGPTISNQQQQQQQLCYEVTDRRLRWHFSI